MPDEIDVSIPSIARVYDAILGGKDNFAVDRALRDQIVERNPEIPRVLKDNRQFIRRVVRWLADSGIDQFVDLGSGLPTVENTHDVAQRVNQDAIVVYVDNDPVVAAYGRALLEDDQHTFLIEADLREPEAIFAHEMVAEHIDLTRPVALLQCSTLHFVPDDADAATLMRRYVDRLVSGSYVVVTHLRKPAPDDPRGKLVDDVVKAYGSGVPQGLTARAADDIVRLFADTELIEPGLVPVDEWWPTGPLIDQAQTHDLFVGGVGRKR